MFCSFTLLYNNFYGDLLCRGFFFSIYNELRCSFLKKRLDILRIKKTFLSLQSVPFRGLFMKGPFYGVDWI